MVVDETEKELEMEHLQPSWIPTQLPFPSFVLSLLVLSSSYQRGLENFLTVHIHVEN